MKNKTRPKRGALTKRWQGSQCVRAENLRTLSHTFIQGTGHWVPLGRTLSHHLHRGQAAEWDWKSWCMKSNRTGDTEAWLPHAVLHREEGWFCTGTVLALILPEVSPQEGLGAGGGAWWATSPEISVALLGRDTYLKADGRCREGGHGVFEGGLRLSKAMVGVPLATRN